MIVLDQFLNHYPISNYHRFDLEFLLNQINKKKRNFIFSIPSAVCNERSFKSSKYSQIPDNNIRSLS
jgi:hypothetical protein